MKTPLFSRHINHSAKMINFFGWELPLEYKKKLKYEVGKVRSDVGMFDVSHMGEIFVTGSQSLELVERLTTNLVSKLKPGEAQYSLITNSEGGIIDDVIVYCLDGGFLICVNASNRENVLRWIDDNNSGTDVKDMSDHYGQIAVQGPSSVKVMNKIFNYDFFKLKPFNFVKLDETLIAYTGYTGEVGFEIFSSSEKIKNFWDSLVAEGVEPVGLGARDVLRVEMKFPLYGNEIGKDTNPFEAGLGFVVKLKSKDFIGKDELLKVKADGLSRRLVGFKTSERIPRKGYKLYSQDSEEIGFVTSGTLSPTLNYPIGIGYVKDEFSAKDTMVNCQIKDRFYASKVVSTPFVRPSKK